LLREEPKVGKILPATGCGGTHDPHHSQCR
jgi:hypothetical protein